MNMVVNREVEISMVSDPNEEIPTLDSQDAELKKNKISWIYMLIFGCPLLLYTVILAIVSATTPVEFLGNWQIWAFIISVPVLGFTGGFFLKKEHLQKSLFYATLFLVIYTALITSGLSGGLEIIQARTSLQIFISFIGGILYGGGFGLVDSIFLILATLASYGIMKLSRTKR
jgi:hypothetical protein